MSGSVDSAQGARYPANVITIQHGHVTAVYTANGWTSTNPRLEPMLAQLTIEARREYSPADGRPDLFVVRRVLERLKGFAIVAMSTSSPAPAGTVF